MRISEGIEGLRRLPPGAALSVGNFDGLHLGHRKILRTMNDLAGGGGLAVVTFEPHPLTVLRPDLAPPRLTPPGLKHAMLADAGVDELVILPPTPEVLGLSAEAFWAILRDGAKPAHLVEGETFTFGSGRGGTVARLREWSVGTGIALHVVDPIEVTLPNLHVVQVSSSLVRWLVHHGRVRDAAVCLGRPYALEGRVVEGFQRGRTLGMPTANLDCGPQLIPADGVYAGRCAVDGRTYPVAMSIGTNPTFGDPSRQVEAHLIGFDGDLYGRLLRVEVVDWLRETVKFDGVEALKAQMARDVGRARNFFAKPQAAG